MKVSGAEGAQQLALPELVQVYRQTEADERARFDSRPAREVSFIGEGADPAAWGYAPAPSPRGGGDG